MKFFLYILIAGFISLSTGIVSAPAAEGSEESFWRFDVSPFAFVYMTDLMKVHLPEKKFRLRVKTGIQYDTNVILNAGSARLPPGIPRQEDWRWVFNLNTNYSLYKDSRTEATVAYTFFQSFHENLSDFNITQNLLEASVLYRVSPAVSVKANYMFHHMLLGGDLYDYANVVGPSVIVAEGKGFFTVFDYRYANARLRNVSIFRRNAEMSGSDNLYGITQNIYVGNSVFLRFGYSHDRNKGQEEYWYYTGDKVFAWATLRLPMISLFDIYSEYYRRDYDGENPFGGGIKRDDKTYTAIVTVTKYIKEKYGLSLRLFYMRNQSTVAAFDYSRVVPSLLVDMRF